MTPEARKYFSLFLQFRVSKNEGCKGTCGISEADLASPQSNCRIKKNNRDQTEVRRPQHDWCQSTEGIRRSVLGRGRQTRVSDGVGGRGPAHPAGAVPVRELGLCRDAVPQAPGQPVPTRCLAAVTFLTFQHHSLRSSLSSLPTVLSVGTAAQKPASPHRMTSSYKSCTCTRKEVEKHLVLTWLAVLKAQPFCKTHLHKA